MPAFKKVLFIDDDPITIHISGRLMKLVEFAGEFVSCEDGSQAKDHLLNNIHDLPDIIFVDLHMAGMNGWQFLSWFENWPVIQHISIPVYVLSSSLSTEDLEQASVYKKVTGYIVKPVTTAHLDEVISKFTG